MRMVYSVVCFVGLLRTHEKLHMKFVRTILPKIIKGLSTRRTEEPGECVSSVKTDIILRIYLHGGYDNANEERPEGTVQV